MIEALTIVSVAATAYVATNLDNLTLLVTLQARYHDHSLLVSAGYLAATLLLGLAGFWIGTAANNMPIEYLGFLGIVPMSLGIIGVVRLFTRRSAETEFRKPMNESMRAVFIATLLTQLGNGTDTVLTFAALFADSTAATDLLIVFTLATMAVTFVLVAIYGVRHPGLSRWIQRNAERLTPWILIFVGAYIVANTATDVMPG